MKFLFSLLLFISLAQANTLPTDFYINKQSGFDVETKNIDDVSKSLKGFFSAGNEVLNKMNLEENKSLSNWKLTGYATTLGVSTSGKFGIVAFKGTSFAEIYWRKKAPAQSFFENNRDLEGDVILTDTSKDGIDEQVENAFAIVKASGKVSNLDEAKKGLRAKIEEFASLASGLQADPSKKYYFSGLRYDLVVGASGNVGTIYNVGGTVLLRMVWRPIKKIEQTPSTPVADKKSELQKLIDDTVLSLESLDDRILAENKGLKLQTIRFGYGRSASGKLGLVTAKSSLVFSVLFGKNQKYKPPGNALFAQSYANNDIKGEDGVSIQWDKFQKGLNKALKLSKPFLDRAEKKESKWEVSMLRMAFTVSGSRGVGLTTVGDLGQVQLIYTK